jgi:LPPG:FO 2-phospho-L-lactate transferase
VRTRLLPMSDDPVRTIVETEGGDLPFQRYLVERHARDRVTVLRFAGVDLALPAPGVLEAITSAEAIFIAPSNPIASIEPILTIPGIRDAIVTASGPCVAVSPIIGGRSLQPPAAEMMAGLGHAVSAAGVAGIYAGLASVLIIDEHDRSEVPAVDGTGIRAVVAPTMMRDDAARRALALAALQAAGIEL